MQKLIKKLDDKLIRIYVRLGNNDALKACVVLLFLSVLIMPESAFADNAVGGAAGLDEMVKQADSIFNKKLMQMAMFGTGIASIAYALFGGFRLTPFITGIGIIVFQILYSTYLKSAFPAATP